MGLPNVPMLRTSYSTVVVLFLSTHGTEYWNTFVAGVVTVPPLGTYYLGNHVIMPIMKVESKEASLFTKNQTTRVIRIQTQDL